MIIGIGALFFIPLVIGAHLIPASYEATAKVLVDKSDTISSILSLIDLKSMTVGITSEEEEYDTDIELAKMVPLLEGLIAHLSLKDSKGETLNPDKLANPGLSAKIFPQPGIEIEQDGESSILKITSTSPDPTEAMNISNTLAKLYIDETVARTREDFKAVRVLVEEQLENKKEDYHSALAELKRFRIEQKVVDLDLEAEKLIGKINDLKSDYERNEQTILGLEEEIVRVEEELRQKPQYRKETQQFIQNEQAEQLKSTVSSLVIELAGRSADIHKEHPDFQRLQKEIESAKDMIKEEAQIILNQETFGIDPLYDQLSNTLINDFIDREIALAQRKLLQTYMAAYEEQLLQIPVKADELTKLQFNISINQDRYQTLENQLYNIRVAEAVSLSNIRLVQPATEPEEESFPKKPLFYIMGILLGGFFGVASAFFLEYIDNSIRTPEDVKKFKNLTLLGIIPNTRLLQRKRLITQEPYSPIVEAYRTIKNNIRYASDDRPLHSLVVTSSEPGEGKSSVVSNLAVAFNMEGKRVLVVDLNVRKPALHQFFQSSGQRGLTNVFVEGTNLVKKDVSTGIRNLEIIPCGSQAVNPVQLIESPQLRKTLERLKQKFDIVILDTPPVNVAYDAVLLGKFVDGIVLVVESGKTRAESLEQAEAAINRANSRILGIVLNKFKTYKAFFHKSYPYHRSYYSQRRP